MQRWLSIAQALHNFVVQNHTPAYNASRVTGNSQLSIAIAIEVCGNNS